MGTQRENLIRELAASAMGTPISKSYTESRFDSATGTLYCNGMMMSKGIIDKAYEFFARNMRIHADKPGPENQELMMFYSIAMNAVEIMREKKERGE